MEGFIHALMEQRVSTCQIEMKGVCRNALLPECLSLVKSDCLWLMSEVMKEAILFSSSELRDWDTELCFSIIYAVFKDRVL